MATEPPATAEEPIEQPPLTYKTHVLKVSIHCEGCKRKVKKVLHSVEGVYKADIDTKLQKVTVTGNVEAQTLLKKLLKSNKHAELWPEPPEQKKDKKSRKSKKKEKQSDPDSGNDEDAPQAEKPPVKVEVVQEPARISEGCSNPAKITVGGGAPVKISGGAVRFSEVGAKTGGGPVVAGGGMAKTGGPFVETKVEGKKPETGSAGNQSPALEKKGGGGGGGGGGESEDCTEKSGGGKKKKKKGQKVGFEGEPLSGGAASSTMQPNHYAGPPQVNLSPPRHHGHQFPPPNYYAPPQQPVYVMSYNTAHPTSSYTTSYYSSPQPNSYAYTTYSGPETEPQPSDFESYPRQPLDSFEMFSDENPNGCSVM